MKVCSCCSIEAEDSYFVKGLNKCKPCMTKYQRKYREANKAGLKIKDAAKHLRNREVRNAQSKANYEANREEYLAKGKIYAESHKEERKVCSAQWQEANKETIRAKAKEYRKENRDSIQAYKLANKEKLAAQNKEWRQKNPEASRIASSARRARKYQATPTWAVNDEWELFFLQEIYHIAKLRSDITCIEFQVDHTVPLKSEIVCGLHWSANLSILTRAENSSKGNRWWPDMP